jgi:TolB-like protein/DNA-binding winged helix-turn-helix (wHTH) protein/Flp pilus assembly protein TadD
MMQPSAPREILRFRDFELDVAGYELRRQGRPVKLGRQQMDLLILLVESRGQLVSRSDIVDRLWGKDVFVDVETGVNTAISKVRQALRDSPEAPAFVETVPGKGYRFIADVEVVSAPFDDGVLPRHLGPPPARAPEQPTRGVASAASSAVTAPAADVQPDTPARATSMRGGADLSPTSRARTRNPAALAIGAGLVAIVAGLVAWTWLSGDAPAPRVSLAVLPFVNLGSDPEREYVAAGLTEETTASLAQIDRDRLSVKGRMLRYKGTTKTAAEIGRELSVDYLVEGAITFEGGRVRVTATLIRVRDQEHVWSQSYEREPSSLLGLQQELSTAIADKIRVRLLPDQPGAVAPRQTQNADAYDAYLRGRYFESRRTPATNALAIEQYRKAIALDPNYALAWASLALTYASSAVNSDGRPLEVWPEATAAAARAVRSNPNLAEAQFAVGYVNWLLDWNWPAAEKALRVSITLDPDNAAVHRTLGHALSQAGRQIEAESAMRRARALDPLAAQGHALSSQVAFQRGDYPAAVEHARRAILLDSLLWTGYVMLGQAYVQMGETDFALEALSDAGRFSGGNSKAISFRGYTLAKTGRVGEAREVLKKLEADARERYVPPYAMALVHAGLQEPDAMFERLEQAYAAHDIHLIYLPVDSKWDPYRNHPRFAALVARCGFAPSPQASR